MDHKEPDPLNGALLVAYQRALEDFLRAALRLQEVWGQKEAAKIMRRAATTAEKAQARTPIRARGRPAGATTYNPFDLAFMMLAADSPADPSQSLEHTAAADRFLAEHSDRLPPKRGNGRARLAYVLYHAFGRRYGASPTAIRERMKALEPIVQRLKDNDPETWRDALKAGEAGGRR